jgi:hypothetical protein
MILNGKLITMATWEVESLIKQRDELLDALEFMLEQFDGPGLHPDQKDACEKAHQLISKAKGEL